MNKYINLIIKRFKKIDWMLVLFLGGFTFSTTVCLIIDFQTTRNIFFVVGIIAALILVVEVSEEAKKELAREKEKENE